MKMNRNLPAKRLTALLPVCLALCLTGCVSVFGPAAETTASPDIVTKQPPAETTAAPGETAASDTTAEAVTTGTPGEAPKVTVTSRTVTKNYTSASGTDLIRVSMTLPSAEGLDMEADVAALEQKILSDAASDVRMAEDELAGLLFPDMFMPYSYRVQYQVTCLSSHILSLTYRTEVDKGGAHGSVTLTSVIYDLATGQKVTLADLTGAGEEQIRCGMVQAFKALIASDPASYYEVSDSDLLKTVDPAQCFITDTGITFYVDEYDIAPYSVGIPYASMTFKEADAFFGCDISRISQ